VRAEPGIDWGDAAIAAYMADQTYGSKVVDFRVPNRNITVPLVLRSRTGTTFDQIRTIVQAKVARWQQEGGSIKRITSAGGVVFADVVSASLQLPGTWSQAWKDYDVAAELTIETLPEFYEAEVTLSDHVETTSAEIIFTETNIRGDYPARVRWVVDDDQGQSQLGLFWGVRSRNYSAGTTAARAYEAELMTPLDTAARAALTGASGGTVVTHGTVATNWTPVLSTSLPGNTFLTHVGSYRWFCRYRTSSGTGLSVRGVYDVGDLVLPEENDPWYHPASTSGTAFYIADLGELRLSRAATGTHRWAGQIQAKGAAGGENVSLDRMWFQPLDEFAGVLRAPFAVGLEGGFTSYSHRDGFNQTAGTLTGKSLEIGGTWAAAGDADPFLTSGSGQVTRATTVDGSGGHRESAGASTFAAQVSQVQLKTTALEVSGGIFQGVLAKYSNDTNYTIAWCTPRPFYTVVNLNVVVGGSIVYQHQSAVLPVMLVDTYYTIRLLADAAGRALVWFARSTSDFGTSEVLGSPVIVASGPATANGKPGIYDNNISSTAATRVYNNFLAWVPSLDAVLNPSQSAELNTKAMTREDSTGVAWGPQSWVEGDLPRLPVAGREARTTQVFFKASRGDLNQLADTAIDDISAQGFYRPCWLYVPKTFESPLDIPGLALWLRSEDIPIGAIATWPDASGLARNATQVTAGARPTGVASVLDGKTVARFDGIDDFMTIPSITTGVLQRTIIIVSKRASGTTQVYCWEIGNSGLATLGSQSQYTYVSGGGGTQSCGGSPLTWQAMTIRWNGLTSCDAFVNAGAPINFDPNDAYGTPSGTSSNLGVRAGVQFGNIDLAEVIIVDQALSLPNLNLLWGFLSRKYPTLGSFGT